MYKCLECGHIFDEGEQTIMTERHGLESPPYEEWSVCPVCGSSYEETTHCKRCVGEFLGDELYNDLCIDCLTEMATYDNLLTYMSNSGGTLEDFMFEKMLDSEAPLVLSWKLRNICVEWFNRYKADDILCDKTTFLDKCRQYVLEDDGEFGRNDFAEWLAERRVK